MYKKAYGQIGLNDFLSPYRMLDPHNRWIRIAVSVPWEDYEKKYAEQFSNKKGAPATRFRMAMGTLIIKRKLGRSDWDTLQDIVENPYMQYLIGLEEFTAVAPFSVRSISNFRKYISQPMVTEILQKYDETD